ncbi:ABC transporter permease subunit [Streptomyces lunaelactis]|uniref:ABC transporter permease n=1 Tax=Streptomyces lunaelactis TaxID=1535768 RepID=UPI001585410D|nr:ABC transporter permease [Streptomyces lunaelactis]NUL06362.1 ABC transporter permease subunit [Streptomyces lunaelactis]
MTVSLTSSSTSSFTSTSSFAPVVHSEWLKIRSVRSLGATLASVFLATVGFSLLLSATLSTEETAKPDFDPLLSSFFGIDFGQIAAICFGALAVAGEYKSGAIRISLAVVPRRGVLYTAKLAVIGGLALLVGLATSLTCFLAGQAFLGDRGVGIGDPGALRAVVGCGIYLALITLFSAGLAAVLRSGPAVMGILIPFLLMVSFVIGDVSQDDSVVEFLPDRAGRQALLQESTGVLGPWTGLGVLGIWVAAALWAGWQSLHRRDA